MVRASQYFQMSGDISIRAQRRTAAQQLALLQVKREISATDPHGRLKYVRDFSEAFRDYRRTLRSDELRAQYSRADILLVGDYHALAASQEFAASLLSTLVQTREGRSPQYQGSRIAPLAPVAATVSTWADGCT